MPKLPFAGDEPGVGALTRPPLVPGLPGFAGNFIPMQQARDLYRRVRSAPQGFRLEALLAEMKIDLNVKASDFDRIPAKGPLVAIANHPFGVLDGAILAVNLGNDADTVGAVYGQIAGAYYGEFGLRSVM